MTDISTQASSVIEFSICEVDALAEMLRMVAMNMYNFHNRAAESYSTGNAKKYPGGKPDWMDDRANANAFIRAAGQIEGRPLDIWPGAIAAIARKLNACRAEIIAQEELKKKLEPLPK